MNVTVTDILGNVVTYTNVKVDLLCASGLLIIHDINSGSLVCTYILRNLISYKTYQNEIIECKE